MYNFQPKPHLGRLSLILVSIVLFTSSGKCEYFVDPLVNLVEFEGWGTSLAWWPDVLGDMPEDVINHVTRAFFSPEGLNLNIVRYTIGGTTPGNYTCGSYRAGAATESFRDGPDEPYNWTRDPRQRRILAIAKTLGADTFEAFSNSPPQWMTVSGCSKGNPLGGILHSNFEATQAPAFAEYIADVLNQFEKTWGIHFQTYVPFNEPFGLRGIGGWFGATSSQEGCNMNQQTMTDTIKTLHAVFQERNISTTISASDETQVDTAVSTQEYFQKQNITGLIGKVNVHGYWDSTVAKRDVLHSNSVKDGHRLWMDEMGWAESSLQDMTQGLEIANRILKDMRVMLPSAWVYWQAMEDIGAWGLLSVPYNNASVANVRYNNGYFAFSQFTRYIRKGFSIVSVNDDNTLAAFDARSQTLVLVIVNPTTEGSVQWYDLQMFSRDIKSISATRTSSSEQQETISQEVALVNSIVVYVAPAESITTVVLQNVTVGATESNLVQDGDFELELSQWNLDGSANITTSNARSGSKSGTISGGQGSIGQVIMPEKAGRLYVSAWCSTTSAQGARLSASSSKETADVTVLGRVYVLYGVAMTVQANEIVTISFEASGGDSYIDNVIVHFIDA